MLGNDYTHSLDRCHHELLVTATTSLMSIVGEVHTSSIQGFYQKSGAKYEVSYTERATNKNLLNTHMGTYIKTQAHEKVINNEQGANA